MARAHPQDPAFLETPRTVRPHCSQPCNRIPTASWGSAVRGRYGDVLPFLVKVLAAEEPLSLQAHPSAEQAVEGYLREDRVGVPLNSPIRNYRDRNHKPEILVALSEFDALGGGFGRLRARLS